MIWVHNIDPVAFHLPFGLAVRWYGLVYALGAIFGMKAVPYLWQKMYPEEQIDPKKLEDMVFWVFVVGVIGGRVFEMAFYQSDILLRDPASVFRIWEGGMSIHGGLIGGFVALLVFSKKLKVGIIKLMEVLLLPLAIVLVFGRGANLINGELIGVPTGQNWGIVYNWVDEMPRHPSQLYHMGKNVIISLVLGLGIYTWGWQKHSGRLLGAFLCLYGGIRAVLHTFREISSTIFGFSVGQVLSLLVFLLGILVLGWSHLKNKKIDDERALD